MVLKTIAGFTFLSILISCGPEPYIPTQEKSDIIYTGRELYEINCANCHGIDGKLGNSGAFDLTKTSLNPKEIKEVILEGRKAMPPFLELITKDQYMDSLMVFVNKLKK